MKKLAVSLNRKSDHTNAGKFVMDIKETLETEELSVDKRLEFLKAGINGLKLRSELRSECRKDALAQAQLDEHNLKFKTNVKIVNIELAHVEEAEDSL